MKTSSSNPKAQIFTLPDFPGKDDPVYLKRRAEIEGITRSFYAGGGELPRVQYLESENGTWNTILSKMALLHPERLSELYLRGKQTLTLKAEGIPQLQDLDQVMERAGGFRILPVEGWIESREFFQKLSEGKIYCSQYIRHASRPEYTPEPDIIHEVVGHLPTLVFESEYTDYLRLLGAAGAKASPEELVQLDRLYWFTAEFGLIEEEGKIKVYGASPAGSVGELGNCFSEKANLQIFDLETVLQTDYPIDGFQEVYFVIPSFSFLMETTKPYLQAMIERNW